MNSAKIDWKRLVFVWGFFLFFGLVVTWRLFNVQILEAQDYRKYFVDQKRAVLEGKEERKEIFAQTKSDGRVPLAINKEQKAVYINPKKQEEEKIKSACNQIKKALSSESSVEEVKFLNSCTKTKGGEFRVLKRGLTSEQEEKIRKLNLDSVGIKEEIIRSYPQKKLASRVVGFLGYEGRKRKGQYGVEAYYDDYLKKDEKEKSPFITTIDYNIQYKAKSILKQALDKYEAKKGTIVVSDPSTGAIKAMAVEPDFNPNKYNQYEDYSVFLNPVVSRIYEPGSIFKPIGMAGGLQEEVVEPTTKFYDKGYVKITGETIYNARQKRYQTSTMVDVLAESINSGAVFVQQELGQDKFRKYVKKFGFGKKTGIDLPYEADGSIMNLLTGRPINYATAAFGQGISVTPIQIINAYNVIANNGIAPQSHLIDLDKTKIGRESFPETRIISNETAGRLTSMLVEVVERGHAKAAKNSSYYIAGKTGTAQVSKEREAGYSDKTVHSFIGFAPAYDPEFVVLVKLTNPKKEEFSSGTAVPVFKRIIEYLLSYYEVPPTRSSD